MGVEGSSFCEYVTALHDPIHKAQEVWLSGFSHVHWIIDHEGVIFPYGYRAAQAPDRSTDSGYAHFSARIADCEFVDRLPVNTVFLAALAGAYRSSSQPARLHYGLGSSVDATSEKAVRAPGNLFILHAHGRASDLISRHMDKECEQLVPREGYTQNALLVFPNDLGKHGARFLIEYIAKKQAIDELSGVVLPLDRFTLPCPQYHTRLAHACMGLGNIVPVPLASLLY